jgi:hypothetical protein
MRFRRVVVAAVYALCLCAAPALAQSTPDGWRSADTGATDPSYAGTIDAPANGATLPASGPITVNGWFVDTTAQGWAGASDVQLYNGTKNAGTLLAHGQVGQDRPDVATSLDEPYWASAGWSATFDASQLLAGPSVLTVYIQTPDKGSFFQQVNVTNTSGSGEMLAPAPATQGPPPRLAVLSPREGENVLTSDRQYVISGTATDPTGRPNGVDWVELWLNGEGYTTDAIHLGDANLKADGSWSLTVDMAQFAPINSNLYAYAHSAVNGKRSVAVVHFYIIDRH